MNAKVIFLAYPIVNSKLIHAQLTLGLFKVPACACIYEVMSHIHKLVS